MRAAYAEPIDVSAPLMPVGSSEPIMGNAREKSEAERHRWFGVGAVIESFQFDWIVLRPASPQFDGLLKLSVAGGATGDPSAVPGPQPILQTAPAVSQSRIPPRMVSLEAIVRASQKRYYFPSAGHY